MSQSCEQYQLVFPNENLKNDTFLRACRGEECPYVPVWMMRQAGRHLPEYRELRKKFSFYDVCTNPKLAAQVTLQPVERYDVDAAIFFTDILSVIKAFDVKFDITDNEDGTIKKIHVDNAMKTPEHLQERILSVPASRIIERLQYVYDGIRETRIQLAGRIPVIGFAGAPWSMMAFAIQGQSNGTFEDAVNWLYSYPVESHLFLKALADVVAEHLLRQIQYGAHAVQLFESWGSCLTPKLFRDFSLPYLKSVAERIRDVFPTVPLICYLNGSGFALKDVASLELFKVISLDASVNIDWAKDQVAGKVKCLQGNLEQTVIYDSHDNIRARTTAMLDNFHRGGATGGLKGHVANLGNGCINNFDPEKVLTFVQTVHSYKKPSDNNSTSVPLTTGPDDMQCDSTSDSDEETNSIEISTEEEALLRSFKGYTPEKHDQFVTALANDAAKIKMSFHAFLTNLRRATTI